MNLDDLVSSHRDYYGAYHHHKEQMAYVAAALYISAVTAVIMQGPSFLKGATPRCAVIALCSIAGLSAHAFVVWQLWNRKTAANIVAGCTTLLARLRAAGAPQPDMQEASYRGVTFPRALVTAIEEASRGGFYFGSARSASIITIVAMTIWSVIAVCSML